MVCSWTLVQSALIRINWNWENAFCFLRFRQKWIKCFPSSVQPIRTKFSKYTLWRVFWKVMWPKWVPSRVKRENDVFKVSPLERAFSKSSVFDEEFIWCVMRKALFRQWHSKEHSMPHVFKCGQASKREQDTIGAYTWASLYQTSVRVFFCQARRHVWVPQCC